MSIKGFVGSVIFFLLILLVFTTILDVGKIINPLDASVVEEKGFFVHATIKETRETNIPDGKLFKTFSLKIRESSSNPKLVVKIPKFWLLNNNIPKEKVKLFLKLDVWTPVDFKIFKELDDQIVYESINSSVDGIYCLVGEVDDGSSSSSSIYYRNNLSFNILIILCGFIFLFFVIHHNENKHLVIHQHKHHSINKLEVYLKKSLLRGHSAEEITDALIKAGWNKKIIEDEFKKIKNF